MAAGLAGPVADTNQQSCTASVTAGATQGRTQNNSVTGVTKQPCAVCSISLTTPGVNAAMGMRSGFPNPHPGAAVQPFRMHLPSTTITAALTFPTAHRNTETSCVAAARQNHHGRIQIAKTDTCKCRPLTQMIVCGPHSMLHGACCASKAAAARSTCCCVCEVCAPKDH